MFELYVSLTNVYWLLCVMKMQNMRKLDKIFCNLSVDERKILMEKLHNDESGE